MWNIQHRYRRFWLSMVAASAVWMALPGILYGVQGVYDRTHRHNQLIARSHARARERFFGELNGTVALSGDNIGALASDIRTIFSKTPVPSGPISSQDQVLGSLTTAIAKPSYNGVSDAMDLKVFRTDSDGNFSDTGNFSSEFLTTLTDFRSGNTAVYLHQLGHYPLTFGNHPAWSFAALQILALLIMGLGFAVALNADGVTSNQSNWHTGESYMLDGRRRWRPAGEAGAFDFYPAGDERVWKLAILAWCWPLMVYVMIKEGPVRVRSWSKLRHMIRKETEEIARLDANHPNPEALADARRIVREIRALPHQNLPEVQNALALAQDRLRDIEFQPLRVEQDDARIAAVQHLPKLVELDEIHKDFLAGQDEIARLVREQLQAQSSKQLGAGK